jgi:superfamily I DNA/RNA helicase
MIALAKDLPSIESLKTRIESLFSDKDEVGVVTLGTTHKLKGLEADRVWMLADTYRSKGEGDEEDNCWYVAVTRAKSWLVMVEAI